MRFIVLGMLTAIFIALSVLYRLGKNKRPLLRAFFTMCFGLGAMLIIDLSSAYTGVFIPVSLLSVGISAGLGVPGVTLILLFNLL